MADFNNTMVPVQEMDSTRAIYRLSEAQQAATVPDKEQANLLTRQSSQDFNSADKQSQQLIAQGEQYLQVSKQAADNAIYSDKLRQASDMFASAHMDRLSQQYDSQGNPTFRQLPQDIENIGNQITQKIAGTIGDADISSKFSETMSQLVNQHKIQAYSTARNQELGFIKGNLEVSQDTFTNMAIGGTPADRQFATSEYTKQVQSAVNSGALSPQQAGKMQDDFRKNVNTSLVKQQIELDPYKAQDMLKDPQKAGLDLSEIEKGQLQKQTDRAIFLDQRQQAVAEKANLVDIKSQMKDMKDSIAEGSAPSDEDFKDMLKQAKGTSLEKQVIDLHDMAMGIPQFTAMDPAKRQILIDDYKNKGTDPQLVSWLGKLSNNLLEAENKDPHGYAIAQGIIPAEKPIDFSQNLAQQINDKVDAANKASVALGRDVSPLTAQATVQLGQNMQQLDASGKQQMIGQIIQGAGDKAQKVFDDLNKTNNGLEAVAGSLQFNKNPEAAYGVLQGSELLKSKMVVMGTAGLVFKTPHDLLPEDVTIDDNKVASGLATGIKALAAQYAYKDGNKEISKEDIENAQNEILGKPSSFQRPDKISSSTIRLPDDIKPVEFQQWFSSLNGADIHQGNPNVYANINGANVTNPKEQMEWLKANAELRQINSHTWGFYTHKDGIDIPVLKNTMNEPNGGVIVKSEPLTITYDEERGKQSAPVKFGLNRPNIIKNIDLNSRLEELNSDKFTSTPDIK